MSLQDLQERERVILEDRKKDFDRSREILDTAEGENRNLNEEEKTNYDLAFNAAAEKTTRLDRNRQQQKIESEGRSSAGVSGAAHEDDDDDDPDGHGQWNSGKRATDDEEAEFRASEVVGSISTNYEVRKEARAKQASVPYTQGQIVHAKAFRSYLRGKREMNADEYRALQMDDDEAGGYIVAPERFVASLIQAIDDQVYIRQWATVQQVGRAQSLGVPSLDADPADSDWTSEIATGSEDSTMDFGPWFGRYAYSP